MNPHPAQQNLTLAWLWVVLGFASGFVMGLFFDREDWLGRGNYGAAARFQASAEIFAELWAEEIPRIKLSGGVSPKARWTDDFFKTKLCQRRAFVA